MTTVIRPQRSGAAGRSRAKERERKLVEAGQLELRFVIPVADLEPLLLTGDASEDDLMTAASASRVVAELLADMARHYAKRLEEHEPRALSLYALTLPGSRTALGKSTCTECNHDPG